MQHFKRIAIRPLVVGSTIMSIMHICIEIWVLQMGTVRINNNGFGGAMMPT